MATIDFPANPILGQKYIFSPGSSAERTYIFKAGISGTASDGYWSSNEGNVLRAATDAEIDAATDDDIYVAPLQLKNSAYGDLLTHHHDTQYLKLIGGTLTGNLKVTGSTVPEINLEPNDVGGTATYKLTDSTGILRGSIEFDETSGSIKVSRYDALGAVETNLVLTSNGNISVNGAAPTAVNHLTRKDYVDTKLAKTNGIATALFETVLNIPVYDIDVSAAGWQKKTLAGTDTFTFSGWPPAGQAASVIVEIQATGAEVLTFTGAVFKDPPVLANGLNTFVFTSSDGGTTINGYTPRDGA